MNHEHHINSIKICQAIFERIDEIYGRDTLPVIFKKKDYYLRDFGWRIQEIDRCVDHLDQHIQLIRCVQPSKFKDYDWCDVLCVAYGNWLNNVYIITERIKRNKNFFRKHNYDIKKAGEDLTTRCAKSLENINNVRGSHIHFFCIKEDNAWWDRLKMMALIANSEDEAFLEFGRIFMSPLMEILNEEDPRKCKFIINSFQRTEFGKVKKKLIKKVNSNNLEIYKLIDYYFKSLAKIVLKDDRLISRN